MNSTPDGPRLTEDELLEAQQALCELAMQANMLPLQDMLHDLELHQRNMDTLGPILDPTIWMRAQTGPNKARHAAFAALVNAGAALKRTCTEHGQGLFELHQIAASKRAGIPLE